ncbi:MAG: filamentous hemagglutinin N-terminal domain-containing protein [Pseudomonadales bacterium]|nr:filamentous hemagglutinin N-terminal domain-containing protein [Pseudomonadales bacterium]
MSHKLFQKLVLCLWLPQLALYPVMSAAEVPVPSANFSPNDGGRTRLEVTGSNGNQAMRLVQPDSFNTYNWDSFNIGVGDSVTFQQPSESSSALNYIHQNSISKIAGQLSANGNLYLINQNGFLFGDGAMVNVGSLVASVLNIDEQMLEDNGLVQSMQQKKPAFFADGHLVDEDGNPYRIEIENGAQIITDGGRVLLVAPEIINNGLISTPDGQTILAAAKEEVYLAASTDPDLRGLFVEVNGGGSVTNGGQIIAERGNISILGMAINQEGTLRATTSVEVNGSIRLLARDTVTFQDKSKTGSKDEYFWGTATVDEQLELSSGSTSFPYAVPTKTGSVTFSAGSVSEVIPDESTENKLATKGQDQRISHIDVMGNEVTVKSNAALRATGGKIQLAALANPSLKKGEEFNANAANETTSLIIEEGAIIDVSGSDKAVLDMSRNQLELKLASNELRDSPLQKEGILSGENIYVDIRESEKIAIADISGAVDKIERSIYERLASGGSVDLLSTGDMQVQTNATIDVSGGSVAYQSGYIFESKLVSNGELIPISKADPLRPYQAILNQGERLNETWKVIEHFDDYILGGEGVYVAAYRQGMDAGGVNITANPAGVQKTFQFDGNVIADTYIGPYQRNHDNRPYGGELNLDFQLANSGIANIVIASEELFRQSLVKKLAQNADDSIPQVFISDSLVKGSVDSLSIKSNADLYVDGSANIEMDGGGSLLLETYDTLSFAGKISNHGGDVLLKASPENRGNPSPETKIEIKSGAKIDVSGLWVNDVKLPDERITLAPIDINAGNISLDAYGSLIVEAGSVIIADGGAHLNNKGKLSAGAGGELSLSAGNFDNNPDAMLDIDSGAELRSMALYDGGTLSLTARGFQIGGSAVDKNSVRADTNRLLLEFDQFKTGGFKKYVLAAKQSGVEFVTTDEAPSTLLLETKNYALPPLATGSSENGLAPFEIKSGAVLADIAESEILHRGVSKSVDMIIRSDEVFEADNANVNINKGVNVQLLAGASLEISSDDSINVRGSIIAHGGDISLKLNESGEVEVHDDSQAIRIFNTATLDVSAFAQRLPDDASFEKYMLFDAGSISLVANRGYILGQGGATTANLIANGADISLVNPNSYLNSGDIEAATETVSLDAGNIYLRAAEGIIFDGGLQAKKAKSDGARGGSLQLVLNANPRLGGSGVLNTGITASYSGKNNSGSIVIQDIDKSADRLDEIMESGAISTVLATRDDLDVGRVYVDISDIEAGGFDRLTLRAINNIGAENATKAISDIRFETAETLQLSEALILDAPSILVNNNAAQVETNYLQIGTTTMLPSQIAAYQSSLINDDSGTLSANAQFVDLVGAIEFSDAKTVSIFSENDIRLIGRTEESVTSDGVAAIASQRALPSGQLIAYGDLNLRASQIAPSTATRYDIRLLEPGTTFRTAASGKQAPILSAQGVINVEADIIEHGGVIKAPFGQINFSKAQTISLQEGSVLSVSGEGQLIPFGQVTDDGVWHYTVANSIAGREPFLINESTLRDKSIRLEADNIDYARGSTVDISGGGDLMAYKWTKGRGGSMDVLSAEYPGDSFAVMPGYGNGVSGRYGIYDAQINGGRLPSDVGQTIYLDGVDGLASGEYAVLPARYAMLPGAFLVTPAGDAGQTSGGQHGKRLDGANIVAGQYAFSESNSRDSQWRPFVIEQGDVAYTRSEYDKFLASQFFDTESNIGRIGLSQDAGNLSLIAGSSLILEGDLLAATSGSGLGARLDISANVIEVVAIKSKAEGAIQLLDSDLNQLEVESILLGGDRSRTADGMSLDVTARDIIIAEGAQLERPEILLAAKERIVVADGASIRSREGRIGVGGVAHTSGDGAFLQVSDGGAWNIVREDFTGNNGDLLIARTASVFGQGSVALESSHISTLSGGFASKGELILSAGALRLGSGSAADENALVLTDEQLLGITAPSIRFKARTALEISRNVNITAETFVLDAPLITGVGEGAGATLTGNEVLVLTNSSETAPPVLSGKAAAARLNLISNNIVLESGETSSVAIEGFTSVFLGKQSQVGSPLMASIVTDGDFYLNVEGDLAFIADVFSAAPASHVALNSTGNFTFNPASNSAMAFNESSLGLGANIGINANSILINSLIRANSGYVNALAEQDVHLGEFGQIDVSGIAKTFGTLEPITEYTDAGDINLHSIVGNLSSHENSLMDLSNAADSVKAGVLTLNAASGTANLQGRILADHFNNASGEVIVALANLSGDSELLGYLSQQGFHSRFDLNLGEGDVLLGRENTIRAHNIQLSAEQGDIRIFGELNASGVNGGTISLASKQGILLGENSVLEAKALSENGDGGRVEFQNYLADLAGGIEFQGGNTGGDINRATIDVSAAGNGAAGHVSVIASLTDDKADVRIAGGGLDVFGAEYVEISPYTSLESASVSRNDIDTAAQNFDAFFAAEDSVKNRLANVIRNGKTQGNSTLQFRPVIDVYSTASLTLAEDINVSDLRFGSEQAAGALWLRSASGMQVANNLHAGVRYIIPQVFFAPYTYQMAPIVGDSWALDLVAGANIKSANHRNLLSGMNDVVLLEGVSVVTGTGDINVHASGNIILNDGASIKSIGQAKSFLDSNSYYGYDENFAPALYSDSGSFNYTEVLELFSANDLGNLRAVFFGSNGGDISLYANEDIQGNGIDQLDTEWRFRANNDFYFDQINGGTPRSEYVTAWGVDYDLFDTGVGTLGGGNILVKAENDVSNLLLAAPTVAKPIIAFSSIVEPTGGGDISVVAGGSINTSAYLVSDGILSLKARESIGKASGSDIATLVSYGNADITMNAGRDIELNGAISEFLTPSATNHYKRMDNQQAYWIDDAANSSISLRSTAGDVYLNTYGMKTASPIVALYNNKVDANALEPWWFYSLLPESLEVTSFNSDILLEQSLFIMPSAGSRMKLLAANNIFAGSDRTLTDRIVTSLKNYQVTGLPSIINPATGKTSPKFMTELQQTDNEVGRVFENSVIQKSIIIANSGDLVSKKDWYLDIETESYIEAGRDIVTPKFNLLHSHAGSVSKVIAGRDINIPTVRNPDTGKLPTSTFDGITLEGPGALVVQAGRDINLGASFGIRTLGDTRNTFLADEGADLYVLAGISSEPDFENFSATYKPNTPEGDLSNIDVYQVFLDELKHAGEKAA